MCVSIGPFNVLAVYLCYLLGPTCIYPAPPLVAYSRSKHKHWVKVGGKINIIIILYVENTLCINVGIFD